MSFHKDQLFLNAALTQTGNSASLKVGPGDHDITAVVQGLSAGGTLDIDVYESADDLTYVKLASFKQISASGEYHRHVQTRLEYLRLTNTVSGTVTKLIEGPTRGADKATQ